MIDAASPEIEQYQIEQEGKQCPMVKLGPRLTFGAEIADWQERIRLRSKQRG